MDNTRKVIIAKRLRKLLNLQADLFEFNKKEAPFDEQYKELLSAINKLIIKEAKALGTEE
ncbi:hypothetical protein [Veillonella criceti]|uniref:Uncharacterized protein n=1 Tax=Veillonella criceti TaxID=103891 RepID=A0A380NJF6_9FIRM|nr:hypothetical protein [Veillonella criceti]SUP42449.1 Uncharacterised protein [Veillonella criceti]